MKRITKYEPSKDSNFPYKIKSNEILELDIIHKLGCFEDIEEELGCSLIVVFKALNEGVYIEVEHLPDVIERPRLYYSDDFKCYCLELLFGEYIIKLSDYQKTWWLKGGKENV